MLQYNFVQDSFMRQVDILLEKNIICKQGNIACFACISSTCQKEGLICQQSTCLCCSQHRQCKIVQISKILNKIRAKSQQVPNYSRQFYGALYASLNEMIDNFSKLKQKYQEEEATFSLSKYEVGFVKTLSRQKPSISGKSINKAYFQCLRQRTANTISANEVREQMKQIKEKFNFEQLCNNINLKFEKNFRDNQFLQNSKIVTQNGQKNQIYQWLIQKYPNSRIQSQRLYLASDHQFSIQNFKIKGSQKSQTLLLVKNQHDKIIGGFNRASWSGKLKQGSKPTTFVFSFNENIKLDYNLYQQRLSNANQVKDAVGFYRVLKIPNNCDVNQATSCFPFIDSFSIWQYQVGLQNSEDFANIFSGSRRFKIKEWQVHQIIIQGLNFDQ